MVREQLPTFLEGLAKESLVNLNWCDVSLGLHGFGYFEEVDTTEPLPTTATYDGSEAFTLDTVNMWVEVKKGIRLKTTDELEADRKATVPKSITMRQARLQLLSMGLLDNVESVISEIAEVTTKRMVQIEWEYAKDIERTSATMQLLASSLSLSNEEVDALFIEANKL